jgi:hypothetical protein
MNPQNPIMSHLAGDKPEVGQEHTEVRINMAKLPKPANITGIAGEKCNNCGGYGFTVGMNGKHIDCAQCEKTGVKLPTIRELQTQISELKLDLSALRKAILDAIPHAQIVDPRDVGAKEVVE